MNALLAAVRPVACLGAAGVSLLGSHLGGAPVSASVSGSAAAVVLLIAAASNVVNDVVDMEADRLDRPERPLVSGRLGIGTAIAAASVLSVAGVALAVPMGVEKLRAAIGFLVAGLAYSLLIRRVGPLSHLWVATIFGASVVWGAWAVGATPAPVWAAAVLVVLFLLPRELLKSVGDVDGDVRAGWRTAAVVWGRQATLRAVILGVVVFAAATLVPVVGGMGGLMYLTAIWVGTVFPLALVIAWLWHDVDHRLRKSEVLTSLMWFPGLLALGLLG